MTCMMVNFSMVLKLLLKGMLIKTFFFFFFNDIVGCYQGCQPQIYQDFIGNLIQPILFFWCRNVNQNLFLSFFFNDIVGCYQGCQPQIYQDFIGNLIQPILFFWLVLLMLKL